MSTRQLPVPTRDVDQANRDMVEHGYALIADALGPSQIKQMTERFSEQAVAEARVRGDQLSINDERLFVSIHGLLNKGKIWQDFLDPVSTVHKVVGQTLRHSVDETVARRFNFEQTFILSTLTGLFKRKEHDPVPGQGPKGHQSLIFHTDQAQVPGHLDFPLVVNTFTALTDYTEANGATMVVPGTHTMAPPPWDRFSGDAAIPIEMPAGTALLVEGRTWHAAGVNTNGKLRASITALYCTPWVQQTWNAATNLRQDVVDELTDAQLKLCGFDTLFQSEYGAFSGPNIIEPTLGRTNVTVKAKAIGELHLT